jgi:nucleotidyltransferase substrate binding protein (TIGR01987 family)
MANYSTRLEAFRSSLASLTQLETIGLPTDDEVFKGFKGYFWCGVIAKFSITFDLSWKLMKDILIQYHGIVDFAKGSPREVLKKSYEADIISDHTWARMLDSRNEISHQYKDLDVVDEWCGRIVREYIPLFKELLTYSEQLDTSAMFHGEQGGK